MAEAASAVAGLVSLGITACQGILAYYNSFKGFRDDIDAMYASVENVARILLAIDSIVSRGRFGADILAVVNSSIQLCARSLDKLEKKLVKIQAIPPDGTLKTQIGNAKRAALYPFRESTVIKLREVCDDLRDNLGLAVDTLNIDAAVLAQQRLDRLSQLTTTMSRQVGRIETGVATIATDVHSIKLDQDASVMADIYAWLTPLTALFQSKHDESLSVKARQDEGARQLSQRPEFQKWKATTGTTLWCTGLPGIGKTVNASYIIEALRQQHSSANVGLAYIYFSYKDAEIQTPVNIVASVLQQLITQSPRHFAALKSLHAQHVRQSTRPSVGEIVALLQDIIFDFSKVFLVIDALDECSDADDVRSILLTELKKLQYGLCLLVMSRPIPDLEEILRDAVRIDIEASPTDIKNYLYERLDNTRSMRKHLADEPMLRSTIVTTILQKIRGMFLMARLYLDTLINKTTRRKIKSALQTLPEGLDSIYEELMIRVKLQNPKDHADLAEKVLSWIFYTARPLTVPEIQHALAIEQDDTSLDEDGIPNRDLLVSVCAGMVMINNNGDTISLVHYTTQEYFQRSGKRLLGHANEGIADTCLTYLHFDSFSHQTPDIASKEDFLQLLHQHPLLGYAAQHWGDHLREAGDEEANEQAIDLLEDEDRVHLVSWMKDYTDNMAKGTYFRPRAHVSGLALASSFGLTATALGLIEHGASVAERDSTGQTALHRATENGYTTTATLLLKAGADVSSKDVTGCSPLHQASIRAHGATARLLIEYGADVNAVDGYNATPLYRAAETGTEEIVRLLLNKHANVSVTNSYLQTALHRAADRGHLAVVELLLKHGADAKAKDHYGYTPFYRAADQGFEDVAKLLRAHVLGG